MASRTASSLFSPLLRQTLPRATRTTSCLQLALRRSAAVPKAAVFSSSIFRAAHTIPRPPRKQPSVTENGSEKAQQPQQQQEAFASEDAPVSEGERPELKDPAYYQLSFTCVPCGHRSHHNISKQGYHKGSTLVTCPSCRNRHVISDHLNIFGDRKITVEDLMREKGRLVKRGSLGEDGDIEFWPEEPILEELEGSQKSGVSS